MTAGQLILDLLRRGVELWGDGGRLRFRAARGALDEPARAALSARRDEVLAILGQRRKHAVASYGQERLWFLEQLEPAAAAYNVPWRFELRGGLDPRALAAAWRRIVRRHETLRTGLVSVAGWPVQVIALDATPALAAVDLSALDRGARRTAARRLMATEARRPFDLAGETLARILLLRLAAGEHVLAITLHHAIADAWSMEVFARELGALYADLSRGRRPSLAPLACQYADYARWQRRRLESEASAARLERLKTRLAGAPPLRLAGDRPRPARRSSRGGSHPVRLPAARTRALAALGAGSGASLFMTLLAGFLALLERLTGQTDLVIGSPIANRRQPEHEGLIGFLVNTLVLRCDLSGEPGFLELTARVRRVVLEAFGHQDLPFERLVEELSPARDLSRNPLFQTLFALHGAPPRLDLPDLELSPWPSAADSARFDLALHLWPEDDGLRGTLVYSAALFDATTGARLAGHFERLLRGALASPGARIADLSRLGRAERHQTLVEWNDTATLAALPCLHRLFEARARRTPEAVAVAAGSAQLTWGALERRSAALAAQLRRRGAGPETVVGVCLERSVDWLASLLAVLRAGAAYLPLDPRDPPARRRRMLEDAGAAQVLTQAAWSPELAGFGVDVLALPAAAAGRGDAGLGDAGLGDAGARPCNLAAVLYTSGSSGRPKGVMLSHRALANRLLWGQEVYPLGPADTVLQLAAPGFDFSLWEVLAPLAAGARLVLPAAAETEDLELMVRRIARSRVSVAHFVPSLLGALLDLPDFAAASLERVFCGGEPLPAALRERFFERAPGTELYNQYGPTETSIDVTFRRCRPQSRRRVTIGRPIAGTAVCLVDGGLRPVPVGVPGEIAIGGAGLARGYLRRAAWTAAVFVPDPFSGAPGRRLYLSGDRARCLADGSLEILGRLDLQVKVRGIRIEPGEIEQRLLEHPEVGSAAVVARDPPGGQPADRRLVACIVPRPGAAAEPEALRGWLGRRLPAHMVPALVVRLERLPRTGRGKIDRAALARDAGERRPRVAAAAPRTPLEQLLAETWRRVLAVPEVGAHDDFFRLGGHSLLATQVISRIRRALRVELPVRVLFERRTVAELAAHLETAGGVPRPLPPPLRSIGRDRELPLSFSQERLWFLDQLEGASAAYNVPSALELAGELDPGALTRALGEIGRRHEALRAGFPAVRGRARQVIAPRPPPMPGVVDLRALDARDQRREARRLGGLEADRPFDLARGPLWRARLLQLATPGSARHILLLTLHHIVSDAWSTGVLRHELAALYRAFAAGRPSPLPELVIQVADFAAWQRRWLDGPALERQLGYWRRQLAGLPELRLPLDRPRPAAQTYRGASCALRLPAAASEAVRELGWRAGASLYMTLLAAFMALLARITGQRDLAVGSPIANRGAPELEALIGFLVNTLVLRGDFSTLGSGRGPTFAQLLERVREVALQAYAHQDMPFEKLVEELAPERDLSRHPLFQVLFTLHNAPRPRRVAGLTWRPLALPSRWVRFDQEWHMRERAGRLDGRAAFNLDLFDATTVQRLCRGFEQLLAAAAARPETSLDELPILSPAARHQLEREWSSSGPTAPATAPSCLELVARQAARAPDAVALLSGETCLSYRRLERRIAVLARRLCRLGVGPEVTVALEIERSPGLVIAALAVLSAGGAYVPVDPAWPRRRRRRILADARPALLVTDGLAVCALAGDLAPWTSPPASPENLAYVIYTSGSTGEPKGVGMRRGAVDQLIRWQLASPGFAAGRRVLQFASISFDVSFQEIFSTLASGGTLVLLSERRRRDVEAWSRLAARTAVERLFLPVVALEQLAAAAARMPRPLPAVGEVIVAGEQLRVTPPVRALFERLGGATLANHYGPSETHVVTALMLGGRPGGWPDRPAIGRPIAGAGLRLLDRRLRPAPAGASAEICVGGAALARGYLRRPARTAARFVPDPSGEPGRRLYRTGDLGRHSSDGTIEFLGRADRQIKIRGFRVEPGEVEAALERHPRIRRAVVSSPPRSPDERRLVAHLVLAGSGDLDLGALRRWLRQELPEPLIPARFAILDRLPLTPTGKIDRGALPPPALAARAPAAAPRDGRERELAGIFARLLDCGPVAPGDDFFRLGGHSLLAVRLVEGIERRLGVRLPLAAVFRHPTVEELAALIGGGDG